MRKLWIEYDTGYALDLNGLSHIYPQNETQPRDQTYLNGALFLTSPSGLGAEYSASFEYVGDAGYAISKLQRNQICIAGTLNIRPNGNTPYSNYSQLRSLILNRQVTLRYNPTCSIMPHYNYSYLVDGYVTKLTKTEIKAGMLQLGFEFRATTNWYKRGSTSYGTLSANSEKDFSASGDSTSFDATFTCASNVTEFEALVMRSGSTIGRLMISGSLSRNDVVRWCTDPTNRLVTINGVDAYDRINLEDLSFTDWHNY